MRRACFFLAFKKYFYVHADGNLRRAQGVYRREQGLDWRFVITSGSRIDTPFRIEWTFQSFKRNYLAIRRPIAQRGPRQARFWLAGAEHWLPWIAGPLCLVHRLAVIVRVEEQRVYCTRRRKVAIDYRRSASNVESLSMKATLFQHFANRVSIARDIGRIAGYIRQRKQLRIAAHNLYFMLLPVFSDRCSYRLRRALLRGGESGSKIQDCHCPSILFQHGCNDNGEKGMASRVRLAPVAM